MKVNKKLHEICIEKEIADADIIIMRVVLKKTTFFSFRNEPSTENIMIPLAIFRNQAFK